MMPALGIAYTAAQLFQQGGTTGGVGAPGGWGPPGFPGGVIIPGLLLMGMFRKAGRPMWWIILYFIPLMDVILVLMLSYGGAVYVGPSAGAGGPEMRSARL